MQFSPQSRVWVYQSNRAFSATEAAEIQAKLDQFIAGWLAHGNALKAKAEIRYNYFIILTVDEGVHSATGCSIDASVRVLKEIEQQYQLDLFNRFNIAYRIGDQILVTGKEDFETLVNIKKVTPETIVFNNMVLTQDELENKWEVPFAGSWHAHIFKIA
ncbi:MAG: ABC transporter ATPase [Pedobacter sp.]|nr:MAG: ABC transporter ATPase [Pedobacter sp.]